MARFEMLTHEDIFIRFRNISTDELRKKPNSSVFEQSSSLDRPPRIDLFVFQVPLLSTNNLNKMTLGGANTGMRTQVYERALSGYSER